MESQEIKKNWSDADARIYSFISNKHNAIGQQKLTCPICSDSRKKKKDRSLSVNVEGSKIIYFCHHCNAKGLISTQRKIIPMKTLKQKIIQKTPIKLPTTTSSKKSEKWLFERGISLETAIDCGCILIEKNNTPLVGFTFPSVNSKDEFEAIKYRTANDEKKYWWTNTATKLWCDQKHYDELPTVESTVIVCEGELDCLAIKESYKNYANIQCFSVPNGAPNVKTSGEIDPNEDGRFKYLWDDKSKFEGVEKIILAVDNDKNGQILSDEISRRLDKARCYTVDFLGCKDANELLLKTNTETVRKQIIEAVPIPLHGLNSISYYADEFESLYQMGKPKGISTGIRAVDEVFTLQTGCLMIVTGYPGDGKSAFIDQLVVNAGRNYGWKTTFCSFEKPPAYHAVGISQLLTGKNFFEGINVRMSQSEKDASESWIDEYILFQDFSEGGMPTIEAILEKAASGIQRSGSRIVVIDPYNFIHNDSVGLQTDAISVMLSKIQLFAKKFGVLVIFVCHPNKPFVRDGKKNVCTGIDISGSMHFFSKADLGLTVYRTETNVEIHCWKSRWSWLAKLGKATLDFNPISGGYSEALSDKEIEDDFDWEF